MPLDCFLLTRQWRDSRNGVELVFWATSPEGPVRICISGQEALFFIAQGDTAALSTPPSTRKPLSLRTLEGTPVDGLYFTSQRDMQVAAKTLKQQGITVYESDIRPAERFLMERFITAGFRLDGGQERRHDFIDCTNPRLAPADIRPEFSLLSFDIETRDMNGELYSIAAIFRGRDQQYKHCLFFVGQLAQTELAGTGARIVSCADERSCIVAFFSWLKECDPDLILGWNLVAFDLSYLQTRCRALGLTLDMGRGRERSVILQPESRQQVPIARIPGRVVLDGIDTLRSATWSFESFSLEHVANELLGRGKRIDPVADKVAEITRLYHESPLELLAYNLEDAQLVIDIFDKADLIDFAVERARLTGLTMDRIGGSVAAFDYLYLPRLHRMGYVAGDIGDFDNIISSPGGYVMDSQPGLYDNVLVLDFKSLYPSIIQTFLIDPLGLAQPGEEPVEGFSGATFSRSQNILPGIIARLWEARDEAKHRHNKPMSQAIKIIMNSFYGVLGTPGCRFFSPKLAGSITRRGHEIIRRSKDYIEAQGYKVIYGDTDSVFVLVGEESDIDESRRIGESLAVDLNRWWHRAIEEEHNTPSFLEIEFETHYSKFIMPTIRGSDKGSKKRYAGLIHSSDGTDRLVFKGLESVRSDWTELAREFQRELYRRIFLDLPYEEYIRELTQALLMGNSDDKLYYRKRLRRELDEYVRNQPPHVQAAKKLPQQQLSQQGWVDYLITVNGPEPRERHVSPIDYEHYIEKQIKPVANGILHFLGQDFETLTGRQMSMF
ncbi:MAG: DNA polymerase II [Gammaproteobacteria bacterium]|nr:DNA polymerase II [Gammaproteobacteria bacterium]